MIWALLPVVFVIGLLKFWFNRRPIFPEGRLKPRITELLDNPDKITYGIRDHEIPKLTGWRFKLMIWLSYTRFGLYFIRPFVMKSGNLDCMGKVVMLEKPTYYPVTPNFSSEQDHTHSNKKVLEGLVEKEVADVPSHFHLPSVADFVRAYRSGKTTPTKVAEAALAAIVNSDKATPPLRAIVQTDRSVVLAMAEASTQRWKEGKTLSLLDGVPVAVKEELKCEPYQHRCGASYLPIFSQDTPEMTAVRKLKEAGAVIIGAANQQEFGTGVLGSSPRPPQLTARNPYDPQCYPGGSSSGSAVSVAAGLCPISLGGDGGGSIRIPSTLCGVVGLKPTFGLVDCLGGLGQDYTVCAVGPLTSSVLDTAIAMSLIARERESDKTLTCLEGLGEGRVDGLKVGVYWDYFNHADKEIVAKCRAALSVLQGLGAELVDIKIPELEETRVAHVVSIATEFASSLGLDLDKHYSEINLETHLLVGASKDVSAVEYINAQKQRTRALKALQSIFEKVDIIVTPGTAVSAPTIDPEAVAVGVCDSKNSMRLVRFAFLANLTGIPGLVLPVGYTASGLPVGLQLMGRWYQENLLLKVGWALEQTGAFLAKKPKVFYDLIGKGED